MNCVRVLFFLAVSLPTVALAIPVTSNVLTFDENGSVPLATPFTFVVAPGVMGDVTLTFEATWTGALGPPPPANTFDVEWRLDNQVVGTTSVGGIGDLNGTRTLVVFSSVQTLLDELNDGTAFLTGTVTNGNAAAFGGTVQLTGNSIAAVPEPTTVILFVFGALAVGRAARKRQLAPAA